MKIVTLVGTRPELIRLSRIIPRLDEHFEQILVHTGQNLDPQLRDVFFEELGIRRPDYDLNIETSSLGTALSGVFQGVEQVINEVKPNAFLALGDTNSALGLIMAKRMRVPTYHMEAGNRCFDENVPEETNRRILDHACDFNLVYTEHARRNLLREGLHPRQIHLTGSPMSEVIHFYEREIRSSEILPEMKLSPHSYFLVSAHREETVDSRQRLMSLVKFVETLAAMQYPVVLSVHPRTRKRLNDNGVEFHGKAILHEPFGFFDYCSLQMQAACVFSDSGTISEESAILGFPSVTIRASMERPEALDEASVVLMDVDNPDIEGCLNLTLKTFDPTRVPAEYRIDDTSRRVVRFVQSTYALRDEWLGIRR